MLLPGATGMVDKPVQKKHKCGQSAFATGFFSSCPLTQGRQQDEHRLAETYPLCLEDVA